MKLEKKTTTTLLIAIFILSMTSIQANAAQTQFFFGDVTINGSPAPWNTLVEAKIAGVLCDSELTAWNTYGYQSTFWVDDAEIGDIIDFYVDGVLARSYKLVAFGQLLRVDLSVTLPVLTLYPDMGISVFWINGEHFTPNADLTLTWDGMPLYDPLFDEFKVLSDGTFQYIGIVGTQGDLGWHTVMASDGVLTASAQFFVLDMKGDTGDTGQPGPQGEQGVPGEIGPQGEQGATGPRGPTGPRGLIGERGYPGQTGATGLTGETGPQGSNGTQGPQGEIGPTGLQGASGTQGETGPPGETGEQGPKGDTGEQGPAGPQGEKGPAGTTGDRGPPIPVGTMGGVVTLSSVIAAVLAFFAQKWFK